MALQQAGQFREALHTIPFKDDAWNDLITLLKNSSKSQAGVMLITRDDDHDILDSYSPDFQISPEVRSAFEKSQWITAALPEQWSKPYLEKGVVRGTDFVSQSEMRKTPFYTDILSTLDLEYLMAGVSLFGSDYRTLLKFFRSPSQPDFSESDAFQLAGVMPEIRQMMRFTERLYERMVVETAAYRAGAPAGAATIIIDGNGKIVHANTDAENVLRSETLLKTRQDKLNAIDVRDDQAVQKMIHIALGLSAPAAQDCAMIGEGSEQGIHQMLALPAPVQEPPFPWMRTMKVAAIVVVDPVRQVMVAPAILKTLFGLTPAEIELVNVMANGTKPTAYAKLVNKSVATVNTQRQSVLSKVGVSSQLDLMRKLRDLIVSCERMKQSSVKTES